VSAGRSPDALPEVGRRLASRPGRLSANGWAILQTAAAAGIAYFLASTVLGNEQPFFAPVAAVVTLGLSFGERGRRALQPFSKRVNLSERGALSIQSVQKA
jgi:hypothetical protein